MPTSKKKVAPVTGANRGIGFEWNYGDAGGGAARQQYPRQFGLPGLGANRSGRESGTAVSRARG